MGVVVGWREAEQDDWQAKLLLEERGDRNGAAFADVERRYAEGRL